MCTGSQGVYFHAQLNTLKCIEQSIMCAHFVFGKELRDLTYAKRFAVSITRSLLSLYWHIDLKLGKNCLVYYNCNVINRFNYSNIQTHITTIKHHSEAWR